MVGRTLTGKRPGRVDCLSKSPLTDRETAMSPSPPEHFQEALTGWFTRPVRRRAALLTALSFVVPWLLGAWIKLGSSRACTTTPNASSCWWTTW